MFQRLSLDQFSWYFNSKPHLRPKIWTRSPLVPVPLAFCNISSTITKRRACESSTSMAMVKAVSGEMCGNKTSAWQRELCWCPWQSKNVICHDISWYNDIYQCIVVRYVFLFSSCPSFQTYEGLKQDRWHPFFLAKNETHLGTRSQKKFTKVLLTRPHWVNKTPLVLKRSTATTSNVDRNNTRVFAFYPPWSLTARPFSKLPNPNRKGESLPTTIFQGRAVKLCVFSVFVRWFWMELAGRPFEDQVLRACAWTWSSIHLGLSCHRSNVRCWEPKNGQTLKSIGVAASPCWCPPLYGK